MRRGDPAAGGRRLAAIPCVLLGVPGCGPAAEEAASPPAARVVEPELESRFFSNTPERIGCSSRARRFTWATAGCYGTPRRSDPGRGAIHLGVGTAEVDDAEGRAAIVGNVRALGAAIRRAPAVTAVHLEIEEGGVHWYGTWKGRLPAALRFPPAAPGKGGREPR